MGIERPRVALLNIGSEDSKGDQLRRETYQALREVGDGGFQQVQPHGDGGVLFRLEGRGRVVVHADVLNIGSEDSKGDQLRRETYQALREAGDGGHLNFVGNMEAKEAVKPGGCPALF